MDPNRMEMLGAQEVAPVTPEAAVDTTEAASEVHDLFAKLDSM